jgi:hypothetical protein
MTMSPDSDGHLTVICVTTSCETARAPEGKTPQELVTAFLEGTSGAPSDEHLEDHLVVTDGERTWDQDSLETVTSVSRPFLAEKRAAATCAASDQAQPCEPNAWLDRGRTTPLPPAGQPGTI